MMSNTAMIVLGVLLILLAIGEIVIFRFIKLEKRKKLAARPIPTNIGYTQALEILNTVALSCIEERKFILRFNDKLTIPPLDEEMIYMTDRILNSLSKNLMQELYMYLGRDFVIRYVSTLIRAYCQEYIEEVRFAEKK